MYYQGICRFVNLRPICAASAFAGPIITPFLNRDDIVGPHRIQEEFVIRFAGGKNCGPGVVHPTTPSERAMSPGSQSANAMPGTLGVRDSVLVFQFEAQQ
jgi:hypothetical protein